jgi:hypothetical protein
MAKQQIKAADYRHFVKLFERGTFRAQRFGQAFLNHFALACPHMANEDGGEQHPCIFNEPDQGKARKWIETNGVDWSQQ